MKNAVDIITENKYQKIVFIFVISLLFLCFHPPKSIRRLEKELKNANPSRALEINIYLSEYYLNSKPLKSNGYAKDADDIAEDIGADDSQQKRMMITFYRLGRTFQQSNSLFGSARKSYETSLKYAKKRGDLNYKKKNSYQLYQLLKNNPLYKNRADKYHLFSQNLNEIEKLEQKNAQLDLELEEQSENLVQERKKVKEKEKEIHEEKEKVEKLETEKKTQETTIVKQQTKIERKNYWLVFLILFIIVILLFSYLLRKQYAAKKKANRKLIVANTKLNQALKELEQKNTQINDSIEYAKKIQYSILRPESELHEILPDSCIFFQPKDILSGDFYWFHTEKNLLVLAAVDCTGHGIPGAMMSMVGNSLLNKIVKEQHITNASAILDNLHTGVVDALQQLKDDSFSQDGMDLSLCVVDTHKKTIEFAGAKNDLYVVIDGKLRTYNADYHSIGGRPLRPGSSHILKFSSHEIECSKPTTIYMLSDGYLDQFGGEEGKKFNLTQFKQLVSDISHLDFEKQKKIFNEKMQNWMGNYKQIDDMIIIGFRFG